MKRVDSFLNIAVVVVLILALVGLLFIFLTKNFKPQREPQFRFTSVDTMKLSRDNARDPESIKDIPFYVKAVADLGATHIAIGTPYDEEFYPVLNAWVREARKHNLKVWFRGNFSSWEGWFEYPEFSDVNEHHSLTTKFIENHPELFEKDDIFTPVPEAENGGMGDPRENPAEVQPFNEFLVKSYDSCVSAFEKINKPVRCGYFSSNGDIARDILTEDTVRKTGNTVVIDHYIDSAQRMDDDITYLINKFPGAKIVIGEFGAPVEDINGRMTEEEQASFISSLFDVFIKQKEHVVGVNYWVLAGGGTAIYKNKTPLLVAEVIKEKFSEMNNF